MYESYQYQNLILNNKYIIELFDPLHKPRNPLDGEKNLFKAFKIACYPNRITLIPLGVIEGGAPGRGQSLPPMILLYYIFSVNY